MLRASAAMLVAAAAIYRFDIRAIKTLYVAPPMYVGLTLSIHYLCARLHADFRLQLRGGRFFLDGDQAF
jgi:hypothetical protein